MEFSPDQQQALDKVSDWIKRPTTPFFTLMGNAGAGKTSLARHLAAQVSGRVYFVAFTGKAAHVLQKAGCDNAATIHSLIYQPQEKSTTRLTALEGQLATLPEDAPIDIVEDLVDQLRIEKENVKRPSFKLKSDSPLRYASLVIVDECSMVDMQIGADLMSFDVPVLALGDPGQLPPIHGRSYFTTRPADYLLTKIHRQAENSPIIKMATLARKRKPIPEGDYGEGCAVLNKASEGLALSADQILVGLNVTRRQTNNWVRKLLGRKGDPVVGEKVICLRNNADLGLLNGSLWRVTEVRCSTDLGYMMIVPWDDPDHPPVACTMHMHHFQDRIDELGYYERKDAQEFDFGYAITVHKSQGSQWKSVLIKDESRSFSEPHKHLYTAITRASEKVVIIT